MGRQPGQLSEKHWQALKLLEEGSFSRKEIADKIGVSKDYFNDLCSGNIEKAGLTADLFLKELKKIEQKNDEKTRSLVKTNTVLAHEQILRILKDLKAKKRLTLDEKKLIGTLANCLNKSTPAVSIGSLSYSYTQGLTPEELVHEFTRLKSIAESSFNRRGIQGPGQDGSGSVPEVDESRSGLAQDS